jgi:phosphoribosylanthranilate isomerase
MTVVKICGLRTTEHACTAAEAGADLIGFVFAASRRRIAPEQAASIIAAVRQHPQGQRAGVVGLFVNEQPAYMNAVIERCNLDYVQLSGDETPEHVAGVCRPVIKVLRLTGDPQEHAWLALAQQQHTAAASVRLAWCPFIVDAHVAGSYGGSGTLADWQRAAHLAQHHPLLLAGGLTPANVAAAMQQVQPWGVDVSSGVERDGVKEPALMKRFIHAVRTAAPTEHRGHPSSATVSGEHS